LIRIGKIFFHIVDLLETETDFTPGGTRNFACQEVRLKGDLCQCREWAATVKVRNKLTAEVSLGDLLGVVGGVPDWVKKLADNIKKKINAIEVDYTLNFLACCDGTGKQEFRFLTASASPLGIIEQKDNVTIPKEPFKSEIEGPFDDAPVPPRPR
jgi:hypothetical protein